MKRWFIALGLFLVAVIGVDAQSIPKLKRADEIMTGSFPNGMDYYFVANTPVAGRADFALLQIGDFSAEESRNGFEELDHINAENFLLNHGVPYTEDGFVSYYDGARVFRFPDVNVKDKYTADSTFLMMLDFMQLSDGPQTVIVCGDIDKNKFQDRFSTLSLVVPKLRDIEYESSIPKDGSVFRNDADRGRVVLSFQQGTANREQAGTAVPLVSEYLFLQFRNILCDRIKLAFTEERIPFYMDISSNEIKVFFDVEFEDRAQGIINEALADLANCGTTGEELTYAKNLALPDIIANGLKLGKPNSFYVDKCISAILTGSNLASEETIKNFFSRRKISAKRDLELFNNYASALLGGEYEFKEEFKYKRQSYPDINAALKVNARSGVKLVNTTTDPLTGGKHWMFNNGIKVVYKYLPNADGFDFCLALRGGASSMNTLHQGESRFLPDMFYLNRYAGIEGQEFNQMLRMKGIEINGDVTLENTVLGIKAPSEELETVMKAVLKIAYDRTPDDMAFEFYRECSRLRSDTQLPAIYSVMDSLMCPTYEYHANSSARNIKDGLLERSNEFYRQRFSNMSDGVFIFIGNIREAELLSVLTKYLGMFDTSGPYALRERVQYDFYSGRTTYIVNGDEPSVNLAATGLIPVTIEDYLTFLLAQEAVRRQFAKSLFPVGMYSQVSGRLDIAPVERFTFYITLRPCAQDGLPEGVSVQDPMEAINVVREEFSKMQYMVITDEEFASYKDIVRRQIESSLSSPQGLMEYAVCRYSNGRDLTSNYKKILDSIVIDDVRWILEEIISAGIVEYIVK